LCVLAGLRAAVGGTLDALSPAKVEDLLAGRSFVLKNRAQAAWGEYAKLHGAFHEQATGDPDSPVNRAFRTAYELKLQELDGVAGRSQVMVR
jgi:predicted component of type VI protein secretion system